MKNITMSMILATTIAMITPAVMATPHFPAAQMAQTQITALTFKEIMRKFYDGQMNRTNIDDKDIEKMPHIGLGSADKNGESTVALMHPLVKYNNSAHELRYLVIIEKIQVNNDGSMVSCHVCAGTADLYSFKKLPDGKFQLVSRSAKKAEFSGSFGRVNLDSKEISANIKPLGKNLVGSTFTNSYSSTGETETWWEALHLPENDFIATYVVGNAGSDNSGNYDEDSPLNQSYEGQISVLNNNSDYYPIKLTYTGDLPSKDFKRTQIVTFDPIKGKYK